MSHNSTRSGFRLCNSDASKITQPASKRMMSSILNPADSRALRLSRLILGIKRTKVQINTKTKANLYK